MATQVVNGLTPQASIPDSKIFVDNSRPVENGKALSIDSSGVTNNKNVHFYKTKLEIDKQAQELLEKYSKIPADEIESHVFQVRERAWSVWPYPCIGTFLFLDLTLASFSLYPQIIKRIQGGQKLLDIGCCFGQDVRKLVFDGAPAENIWGSDLEGGFLDLGYELFRDKDTLKAQFFPANALDPESPLKQLNGQIDIIYAGFFFHLFDWDEQLQVATSLIQILKPQKGSLIVGKQAGNFVADTHILQIPGASRMWKHSGESFTKMWEEAGQRTGTKWRINAWVVDVGEVNRKGWMKWLHFDVERL